LELRAVLGGGMYFRISDVAGVRKIRGSSVLRKRFIGVRIEIEHRTLAVEKLEAKINKQVHGLRLCFRGRRHGLLLGERSHRLDSDPKRCPTVVGSCLVGGWRRITRQGPWHRAR